MARDYYELLGVDRGADEAAVKKAFRRLARELHPDVNAHDPTAEERFKEAAEAYEVLSDGARRQQYDAYGHEGLRTGGYRPDFEGFGSISDLFSAFFGQGGFTPGGPQEGADVSVVAAITLADSARGTQVEVGYDAQSRCETCHGNGAQPGTRIVTCARCGGSGQLQAVTRSPFGQIVRTAACDRCHGDGRVPEQPCASCGGRGMVLDERRLVVDVPAGIADGQRIRLPGRGHEGERGGAAGDLYVLVRVAEDERFVRDGDDLVTVLDVPVALAALGATLEVDTLDGLLPLEIPAGTQPGETLLLRGHGMPPLRRGRRGDLRVVVNVAIPRRLDRESRELFERLAERLDGDHHAGDEGVLGKLRRVLR